MTVVLKDSSVRPPPSSLLTPRVEFAARALILVSNAARVRVTLTDWYRDATANLAAGGADASQHLAGTAFDVRADAAGERVAQIWRAIGGRVRDERAKPNAPHWHLDLG